MIAHLAKNQIRKIQTSKILPKTYSFITMRIIITIRTFIYVYSFYYLTTAFTFYQATAIYKIVYTFIHCDTPCKMNHAHLHPLALLPYHMPYTSTSFSFNMSSIIFFINTAIIPKPVVYAFNSLPSYFIGLSSTNFCTWPSKLSNCTIHKSNASVIYTLHNPLSQII